MRLLLISFTLLLAACSTTERLVREQPPLELIRECVKPPLRVTTNGELASSLKAMEAALDLCNIDKATLRRWSEHGD